MIAEALNQYTIIETIGHGRLGDLYRARDTALGRTVAIRVLTPGIAGDPERKERFLLDAHRSATLLHPNIAALYEVGEAGNASFLASEYVSGQTLENVVGGRPLNPRRAIDLAIQIGDALADAHARGVVHGALTPDGLVVTPKGSVKILDFGLASWTRGPTAPAGTTADYLSDILSLGLILFKMLVGRPPTGIRTPSSINPDVPRELDAIVIKATAKNSPDRYQSAAALSAALREAAGRLADRDEEDRQTVTIVSSERSRTRRGPGWLIFIVLVGGLGLIAWLFWIAPRVT